MDKKFIAAVAVCVVALVAVATGTIFLGQKSSNIKTSSVELNMTTKDDVEAAQEKVAEFESEVASAADRVGPQDDSDADGYEGESNVVRADEKKEETTKKTGGVEANGETGEEVPDEYRGLSSEAAAQIDLLKFGKNTEMLWPVEGNIMIPFDMDSTVYFSTLDEYKTSPGIVIQSSQGTAIKAAAAGVITRLEESDEYGVCIKQALGNDYIATYGQITNPEVAAGDYVEAGQVIGYVAAPSKYYAKEGDNLYFAISKNGKAVDPLNHIVYED